MGKRRFAPVAAPQATASNTPATATQAASDENHIALEQASVSSTPELRAGLKALLDDLSPRLFNRRSKPVKEAEATLQPLATKMRLSRTDMLTMLKATQMLQNLPSEKQTRSDRSRHAEIQNFGRVLERFIGPADALRGGIEKLSAGLESHAKVADLQSYMLVNHPDMLQRDPQSGDYQLTKAGITRFPEIKQMFELTEQKRHVIPTNALQMTQHQRFVMKLVDAGSGKYQRALRQSDESIDTKATLIECAQIVESLASAKPENVSRERYASVFPGGLTEPDELVVGREYREPGFVFIGGERRDDQGREMKIRLAKGYPVDARSLYGHSRANNKDDKLQWLSLPGANFRYDGVESDEFGGHKVYLFTQVERSPE